MWTFGSSNGLICFETHIFFPCFQRGSHSHPIFEKKPKKTNKNFTCLHYLYLSLIQTDGLARSLHDTTYGLDPDGVGELITMAVQRGRSTRPEMKMGICGEHGGDPASIEVCEKIGLDYVSCSPFRVPVARLAAAQSALKTKGEQTKQSSTKKTKPRVQNFGPW